jgi:hypothetical protein
MSKAGFSRVDTVAHWPSNLLDFRAGKLTWCVNSSSLNVLAKYVHYIPSSSCEEIQVLAIRIVVTEVSLLLFNSDGHGVQLEGRCWAGLLIKGCQHLQ